MRGFLEGYKILDFGQAIAGTFATMLLGDLGADVIKIERVLDPEPKTTSIEEVEITQWMCNHWAHNRNKRGIALDMKNPKAREVFYGLVTKCDVVFDNFRPHVLKDIGIDYDTLKKYNPRIISCSISGYGQSGPWKEAAAYDLISQAMSGFMSITGEPGRMPLRCGAPIGDLVPGLYSAFAMTAALLGREKTGEGQRIDMAMLDCMLSYQTYRAAAVFSMGKEFGPTPRRSGAAAQVPYGAFKCSDGRWVAITGGAVQFWGPICKAMNLDHLINDPRYDTNTKRQEREVELTKIFEDAFAMKPADEWVRRLFEVKVPAAKVHNIREAFEHPQSQHRKMLVSFDKHPLGKKIKLAANPLKVENPASQVQYREAPALGEHTREVLSEMLGYSPEKLAELKKAGAIWWADKGVHYAADYSRFA
jgi:crotonobetainyl-CoA:carnitine CoA-transferase CaiB-like acyl-CoA transferase